ncbi:MAG: hypothetical protein FGM32_04230 [Candidatus Kapabacteria bacterium]|nr:hypothetical protein [Candidatus Kapabacteria bacterium]
MNQRPRNDRWMDLLLLRMREPVDAVDRPYYTTGSIVTAAMIRVALLGLICIALAQVADATIVWWTAMLSLWGLGIYPAWLQHQAFHETVERITVGTLCGACRYFNETNQLCTIMDVHVTSEEPPCEGEGWEPLENA